ncbi:MAG: hypothetical protein J0H88_16405 [Sphingomonadales bacterium]|nr:hypothetical protein [Sphingomonadales bacterium]
MKLDRPVSLSDLPIPANSVVTGKWTAQMCEMADHLGPFRTLLVIDALGGQQIDVPKSAERNRMAAIIGEEGAKIMSRIYGGNRMKVPVGRPALNEARRAGVIAAIRDGKMSIGEAVPILGTSHNYISHLVNKTDEGKETRALDLSKLARRRYDPRQLDMFAAPESE